MPSYYDDRRFLVPGRVTIRQLIKKNSHLLSEFDLGTVHFPQVGTQKHQESTT